MSTQTKSSSRPWLVFIGCCVLSLVGFGLIVNTPGLYFTVLGETLNVSRTQIALASSIMAIAGAVTMLFAGKVMKMLDSRILISVCIAGVAALFLAQSFFNAVWQFYISFALMGILYVIPISLAPSVLLANWFESKLGMVMGIVCRVHHRRRRPVRHRRHHLQPRRLLVHHQSRMADLLPPNRTDPRYLHPAVLPAGVQVPPRRSQGRAGLRP